MAAVMGSATRTKYDDLLPHRQTGTVRVCLRFLPRAKALLRPRETRRDGRDEMKREEPDNVAKGYQFAPICTSCGHMPNGSTVQRSRRPCPCLHAPRVTRLLRATTSDIQEQRRPASINGAGRPSPLISRSDERRFVTRTLGIAPDPCLTVKTVCRFVQGKVHVRHSDESMSDGQMQEPGLQGWRLGSLGAECNAICRRTGNPRLTHISNRGTSQPAALPGTASRSGGERGFVEAEAEGESRPSQRHGQIADDAPGMDP